VRQGLAELGYVDGRDIFIEARWAEGRVERLPELAAELVGLNPDIIVTLGGVATRAAKNATSAVPIVFAVVIDPVAGGLVPDRQRPGGNLTGFTSFDPQENATPSGSAQGGDPGAGPGGVPGRRGRSWLSGSVQSLG
jgi:putative ABC transport system substrate-binding protein